jgi:hypothetical protein
MDSEIYEVQVQPTRARWLFYLVSMSAAWMTNPQARLTVVHVAHCWSPNMNFRSEKTRQRVEPAWVRRGWRDKAQGWAPT